MLLFHKKRDTVAVTGREDRQTLPPMNNKHVPRM